jgi:hypothetical protein
LKTTVRSSAITGAARRDKAAAASMRVFVISSLFLPGRLGSVRA